MVAMAIVMLLVIIMERLEGQNRRAEVSLSS